MPFKLADRVKQTATTTGTGNFTLSATPTGFRAFSSVLSTSDTTYYCIAHQTANEWEVGYGTYSATNTLTRTTVISSSNSGSAVNFSAGTKDVFITPPAIGTFGNNVVIGNNITYDQNTLQNSVVVGANSSAAGTSVSVGRSANATGGSATAVGYNALANQTASTAIGYNSQATGSYSVMVGYGYASGGSDVAVGYDAVSSQPSAVAIGLSSRAITSGSLAIGEYSWADATASVVLGPSARVENSAVQWGIAIGSGATVRGSASLVIGAATKDSAGGNDIRIGRQQDSSYPSGATGSGNILIGHNLVSAAANPSNSIGIGNNIAVSQSDATFMNKFRINPSTGLVGPAYGLTYDSTTHEVYAITSGPPPIPAWFTYADYSSAFPATLDLPTGWSSTYSGPTDEIKVFGSPDLNPYGPPSPGGGSWANLGFASIAGYCWSISSSNWSALSSPINLNASGVSDGFAACWIYGVQDDAAFSYFDVLGTLGNSTFTSAPFYGGFPLVGSAPRYGHAVCFIAGVDVTSSAVMPAGATLAGSMYDSYWGTTILFIEYDSAAVSNIQSGSIPLYTLPSSYPTRNLFWYNFT